MSYQNVTAGSTEENRLYTHDTWWDGFLLEFYSSGVTVIQKISVLRITRSTLSEDDLIQTNKLEQTRCKWITVQKLHGVCLLNQLIVTYTQFHLDLHLGMHLNV